MEKLHSAVGAGAAIGSDCFIATWLTKPVEIGPEGGPYEPITEHRQLDKSGGKDIFQGLLDGTINSFGDKKKCILDTSHDAYFWAKGKLVSMFANRTFSKAYVAGTSICYKDLQKVTVDPAKAAGGQVGAASRCKLIRVEKKIVPPAAAPSPTPTPADPAFSEPTP